MALGVGVTMYEEEHGTARLDPNVKLKKWVIPNSNEYLFAVDWLWELHGYFIDANDNEIHIWFLSNSCVSKSHLLEF